MENPVTKLPHKLILDERNRLNLTGATEVIHFDDDAVELNTSLGTLVILGEQLRLKCLSLDDGALVIQGRITSMSYEEPKKHRGFFR